MTVSGKEAKPGRGRPRISRRAAAVLAASLGLAQPALADFESPVDLSAGERKVEIPFEGGTITLRAIHPKGQMQRPASVEADMPGHGRGWARIGHLRDVLPWIDYGQWVGIARLDGADDAPTVLFEAYTGGAHCCSALVALTPAGGKLRGIGFPFAEGELRAGLPVDIDGDGVLDIVRESEHVCDKGECAQRTAIYNIRAGQLLDVTGEPGFAAFLAGLDADADGE